MGTKVPLIALLGNPNSGKTTLFNALTGLNYKVANYPGVTVERKEATIALPSGLAARLVDLPGVYSLSGLSIDEKIATSEIIGKDEGRPDVVIQVCDATNLERNFYLLSQLLDTGVKIVLCLTMVDLTERIGIKIHKELLSRNLSVSVVEIVARKKLGLDSLLTEIENSLKKDRVSKTFEWISTENEFFKVATELGEKSSTPDSLSIHPLLGMRILQEGAPSNFPSLKGAVLEAQENLRTKQIDPLSFETEERYKWISKVVKSSTSISDHNQASITEKIDRVLTHKIWGTIIFFIIMIGLFQSIFILADYPMQGIEWLMDQAQKLALGFLPPGQFRSLVVQGIIAGVGSVIVFVPQIATLFFLLSVLEDTGYLSRAAFLMDRVLRPVGLQGRSFIPLLSSFACAIPGILSTRTIPSWADRLTTIMIAPLMSCSARLPVYTVLIGAFVPDEKVLGIFSLQGMTLFGMYLLGIFGAAIVSALLRLIFLRGTPAIFVMEMPPYRLPIVRNVARAVIDSVSSFLKSAGTVILAITIILWFLASYPRPENSDAAEELPLRQSYAGELGHFIEPVIKPLGFNWEIGVSVLASFAAREVFVSSLATVYNLQADDDSSKNLIELLKDKKADGSFTPATAASLLVFYVFACMCMSTLAVAKRETGSWIWTGIMFSYMTGLAYVLAALTYHFWT